ncbi:hypothetical protein OH77DRAFT_1208652 [Trametes cingulata]|nr:hypothetical protein OH77DRAFT_1208652 [Trametes cingulata]
MIQQAPTNWSLGMRRTIPHEFVWVTNREFKSGTSVVNWFPKVRHQLALRAFEFWEQKLDGRRRVPDRHRLLRWTSVLGAWHALLGHLFSRRCSAALHDLSMTCCMTPRACQSPHIQANSPSLTPCLREVCHTCTRLVTPTAIARETLRSRPFPASPREVLIARLQLNEARSLDAGRDVYRTDSNAHQTMPIGARANGLTITQVGLLQGKNFSSLPRNELPPGVQGRLWQIHCGQLLSRPAIQGGPECRSAVESDSRPWRLSRRDITVVLRIRTSARTPFTPSCPPQPT